jgi:hypothetical protein
MSRSVSVNIELGVVSLILGVIGWLFSSSTLVWIGWWLVFGAQLLIIAIVGASLLFFGKRGLNVKFSPQRSIPLTSLKMIALNVMLFLVWWKTYIPLHWAVAPIILGILFKITLKRNVLPSF